MYKDDLSLKFLGPSAYFAFICSFLDMPGSLRLALRLTFFLWFKLVRQIEFNREIFQVIHVSFTNWKAWLRLYSMWLFGWTVLFSCNQCAFI